MNVAADAILLGQSQKHVLSLDEARVLLAACSGSAPIDSEGPVTTDRCATARLREAGLLSDTPSARDLWSEFGWTRSRDLFECVRRERRELSNDAEEPAAARQVPAGGPELVRTMLARRSRRLFRREPVDAAAFRKVTLRATVECRARPRHRLYLVAQSIEGMTPGRYVLDADGSWTWLGEQVPRPELLKSVHGMWWVNGGGGIFFIAADIDHLTPREYFRTLLETSRICQALLEPIYLVGLGGWMTPALDEAQLGALLGTEQTHYEPLMLLKFGAPRDPLTKVATPEDAEHFEGALPDL